MKFIKEEDNCKIVIEVDCFYNVHGVKVWHNKSERLVLGYIVKKKTVLASSCLSSRDFEGSVAVTNATQEAMTIFNSLDCTSLNELNILGYKEI